MFTAMNPVTKILCPTTLSDAYSPIHTVLFGSEQQTDLHTMTVALIPSNYFLKARMKTRYPTIIFLLSKKMLMVFYGLVPNRGYVRLIEGIDASSDFCTIRIPILSLLII